MAHKAYIVLANYPSSSSDSIYEVRRGGDGVLYCTCRGWIASKQVPRACKHCKDYVARNPGTSYGPQYAAWKASPTPTPLGQVKREAGRAPAVAAPMAVSAAPANWKAILLAEKQAAVARVKQAPDALAAYARDLDLD